MTALSLFPDLFRRLRKCLPFLRVYSFGSNSIASTWRTNATLALLISLGLFQSLDPHWLLPIQLSHWALPRHRHLLLRIRLATWSLRGPRPLPILIQPFQLTLLFLHPLPPRLHHNPPDTILNELCIKSISKSSPNTTTERNFGSRNRTIRALSVQGNRRPTFSTPGTGPSFPNTGCIGLY